MNPMSLKNLYILVLVVASYSLWKLYLHLQQVSRRRTFRLDQRRKFGIPDHDHRDFQVAKRDAILRRERREANLEEKRIAGQGRSSDDSDPNTQAVRQDGHVYEDLFSHPSRPGMVQVEGRGKGAGLLLESGKEALDTSEMIETRALTTERLGAQARAVLDAKTSGKGRKRFQSELGSEAGGGQRKTRKRELDHDPHVAHPSDTIAWGTSNLRGVKRDPLEAREGYDDSVAGNRSFKRRHKLKPDPAGERLMDEEHGEDFLEEDESMGGYSGDEGLEDDGMDVDVTLSKLVTGERGVKRGFQDHDDEELEVGDGPVRDSSVKGNSKRGKSRHDPLQDTQHDLVLLDEDEAMPTSSDLEDDEDTKVKKLPLEERTTSTSGNKRKADTSDDREPGEEWEDLNGLKWKMGEDGVRRRATIIVEMRPKYNMPKDSQHPDAKQKVQVYVEKYLSELEYEDYKKKKLLGYQEAERMKEAEAKQRSKGCIITHFGRGKEEEEGGISDEKAQGGEGCEGEESGWRRQQQTCHIAISP
ncbi:hypothetical protein IE53DRAFT_241057 [Violaceomyces palustris]|uniref:Uncharacterized protein n=1 Tax=Violaceomyces palustris TaxID=1673888 RepID=A0ACD0NP68_9BASI|nr:hypothetical protein IE53DRAFT_241057 [Violaceomyces palustris]